MYPKPRGFDELAYPSRYFNTIEINTSYYGPPRATTAKKWIEAFLLTAPLSLRLSSSTRSRMNGTRRRMTRRILRMELLRLPRLAALGRC